MSDLKQYAGMYKRLDALASRKDMENARLTADKEKLERLYIQAVNGRREFRRMYRESRIYLTAERDEWKTTAGIEATLAEEQKYWVNHYRKRITKLEKEKGEAIDHMTQVGVDVATRLTAERNDERRYKENCIKTIDDTLKPHIAKLTAERDLFRGRSREYYKKLERTVCFDVCSREGIENERDALKADLADACLENGKIIESSMKQIKKLTAERDALQWYMDTEPAKSRVAAEALEEGSVMRECNHAVYENGYCTECDLHFGEVMKHQDRAIARLTAERDEAYDKVDDIYALMERITKLEEALRGCTGRHEGIQGFMRKHGFKVNNLDDPWQNLYFTCYTELCEVDSIATEALEEKL